MEIIPARELRLALLPAQPLHRQERKPRQNRTRVRLPALPPKKMHRHFQPHFHPANLHQISTRRSQSLSEIPSRLPRQKNTFPGAQPQPTTVKNLL
jgi:hypothetical protein